MLTCTPVMSGRNSEDKPSPFMTTRPYVYPPTASITNTKGSTTPTASTTGNETFKQSLCSPFDDYLKKLTVKPNGSSKDKEEDFKMDMDEMHNQKLPYNSIKNTSKVNCTTPTNLSTKNLCTMKGAVQTNPKYMFGKQNTQVLPHAVKAIDDDDIGPSINEVPSNTIAVNCTTPQKRNPFINPFYDQKKEEGKKEILKNFFNDIK